jgi:hypothetical protein
MDSKIYIRTSVRVRTFVFQVLNIHFLREETEHGARLYDDVGLCPTRTPSSVGGMPAAATFM